MISPVTLCNGRLSIDKTAAADTAFVASRAAEWQHAAGAEDASVSTGAAEASSSDSSSAAAAAAWRDAQLKEVAERKARCRYIRLQAMSRMVTGGAQGALP